MISRGASFVLYGGLSVAVLCLGQIPGGGYPGGGYPGGGYPGGGGTGYPGGRGTNGTSLPRFPGKKKKTSGKPTKEQLQSLTDLRGMLRRMDDKSIVLQADDKRFLLIMRNEDTRLLKNNEDAKAKEFVPGDRVIVEAVVDEEERFVAVRVNWDAAGTEKDRITARGPIPESVRFEDDAAGKPDTVAGGRAEEGGGPPKLSRKGEPSKTASSPAPAASPAQPSPGAQPAGTAAGIEPPAAREPGTIVVDKVDLEPVPVVKRGRPAARPRSADDDDTSASASSGERVAIASSAPAGGSVAAPSAAGALPSAAATPATPVIPDTQEDPVLARARESVLNFTEVLPNYMAKQMTTRFVGNGKADRWQPQDNFTADLVYQDGRENYTNVQLNGKPAKGKIEQTGAWSRGEFGTTLRDVFSPASNATFKPRGTATIVNRKAKYFDFTVDQENSHWQIGVPGQTFFPAYRGSIWIDIETARVLRLEMQGRKIPETFPIDTVESAIDFDFVKIGGGNYLVPVHSETLSCFRGGNCNKNVLDFRNYRKFGAQSELILNQ